MPKKKKHVRGRRDAKRGKRKLGEEEGSHYPAKRQKSTGQEEIQFLGTDSEEFPEDEAHVSIATERPFFGLLSDEEQEYFRRTDELLELNDFPSDDERRLFLANVYREAEGKELKIANSQSCSRLMERLILLSTSDQKKKLFGKFNGHFLHLVQHRFASHCCEALFIESAPIVTQELTGDLAQGKEQTQDDDNEEAVHVSMEDLFLYTLNEFEGHIGFLLTNKFASHALRVLLVVLSGQTLAKSSTKSLLQSKRKENIGIAGLDASTAELSLDERAVPGSFQVAIERIISETVAGLDPSFIHILANHPTGNPTMQLLLELELTRQKKLKHSPPIPSIIQKLLPDDISAPNSQSASFINGIIYEPIGSRLLETIVTFAPGKLFKQIFQTTFKERIGSLARNETAGFVVIKVLERLSKADLEEAVTSIIPQIPGLIGRSRTNVIKTLLERCDVRGATESVALLTATIAESYGSDPDTLLLKMTKFTPTNAKELNSAKAPRANSPTLHGSLLAQTMLSIPGPPSSLIQAAILALPAPTILQLACTASTSHMIQTALKPTPSNLFFRRKLINQLLSPSSPSSLPTPPAGLPPSTTDPYPDPATQSVILTLALDKAGSHVLDALGAATTSPGLMMLKERIAALLLENQPRLRDDPVGRLALRNWMIGLFARRRPEWVRRVRDADHAVPTAAAATGGAAKGRGGQVPHPGAGKTPIQLARERFSSTRAGKNIARLKRAPKAVGVGVA